MRFTDVHVHLGALPTFENHCRMSRRMRQGRVFQMVARLQGLPIDDPRRANLLYLKRLRDELSASKRVESAVVLGMDGVYDSSGELDDARTDLLVSNDYVFEAVRRVPELFLPGVSINPMRRDAQDELERCAAMGAFLVKWLPNSQCFDPADQRCRPFYRSLARLKLPLLCHVGFEFSLIGRDQSLGDLDRLAMALDEGVCVIAAHGASSGRFLLEKNLATFRRFAARHRRLYADVSALTLANRVGALLRLRRRPELFGRLLFGTDYPMPVLSYPCLLGGSWADFKAAKAEDNRFDRQALVLESLGIMLTTDVKEIKKSL